MYLSTITEKDIKSKKNVFIRAAGSNLATADIEGSRPCLKGYQYFNKPSYANTTDQIEKASPRQLHQKLDKPQYSLSTKDIEKAYPSKTGFQTKRIGTNPLNPTYQLPYYEVRAITPPKFIRDHINISDIEGTKPEIYYKWNTRNSMDVNDIEGAMPRPEKKLSKPNFMDPRDINRGTSHVYNRCVNPLMPEYVTKDDTGALITIGHVEGSNPKKAIKTDIAPHNRHLDNRDIEGSTAGTLNLGILGKKERNYEKKIVNAADIEGAQSGSLKKGITTIRTTNPLDPIYKWKTEDSPPPVVNKSNEVPMTDPIYAKSLAKFWGASPPVSEKPSPPPSKSSSRQSDFKRNANKFFSPDSLTEETQKKNFTKNTEKFFENGQAFPNGINYFESLNNKGSIHKLKPKSNFIDTESPDYERNKRKFFTVSRSSYHSNGSNNEDFNTDNKQILSKLGNRTPEAASKLEKRQENLYEIGNEPYRFNLPRSEIAKPMDNNIEQEIGSKKSFGTTPPASVNSERNLLVNARKK